MHDRILGKYLKQTWGRRDFIIALAKFRLQSDLSENRLGILWLVLRPVLNAAVYGLIFGVIQGTSRGADYPATVVTGVFLFEYFSPSLSRGAKSVTGNRALVQSLAFPRLTLPVAEVIEGFFSLLPSLLVLAVLLPILGHSPTLELAVADPAAGPLHACSTPVSRCSSRASPCTCRTSPSSCRS